VNERVVQDNASPAALALSDGRSKGEGKGQAQSFRTGRGSRRTRAFSAPNPAGAPTMTMPTRQLVDVALEG
jgi:hypothetical protein